VYSTAFVERDLYVLEFDNSLSWNQVKVTLVVQGALSTESHLVQVPEHYNGTIAFPMCLEMNFTMHFCVLDLAGHQIWWGREDTHKVYFYAQDKNRTYDWEAPFASANLTSTGHPVSLVLLAIPLHAGSPFMSASVLVATGDVSTSLFVVLLDDATGLLPDMDMWNKTTFLEIGTCLLLRFTL
jgi:hypothetical protein